MVLPRPLAAAILWVLQPRHWSQPSPGSYAATTLHGSSGGGVRLVGRVFGMEDLGGFGTKIWLDPVDPVGALGSRTTSWLLLVAAAGLHHPHTARTRDSHGAPFGAGLGSKSQSNSRSIVPIELTPQRSLKSAVPRLFFTRLLHTRIKVHVLSKHPPHPVPSKNPVGRPQMVSGCAGSLWVPNAANVVLQISLVFFELRLTGSGPPCLGRNEGPKRKTGSSWGGGEVASSAFGRPVL